MCSNVKRGINPTYISPEDHLESYLVLGDNECAALDELNDWCLVIKRHCGVPGEVASDCVRLLSVCISDQMPDVSGWEHHDNPSALMLADPTKNCNDHNCSCI